MGRAPEIKSDEMSSLINVAYHRFKPRIRNPFEGDTAITRVRRDDLGEVPRDLKCIDSLLVFNSNMNPYKHYKKVENTIYKEK